MEHTHKTDTERNLPFGGVTLSICSCGARKRSDGRAIDGCVTDIGGWSVTTPINEARRAYDLIQSEGYEPDTRDTEDVIDGINSNTNID